MIWLLAGLPLEAWRAGSLPLAGSRSNITKYFVGRASLRSPVANPLDALSDFLVPCFLDAFVRNIFETDQQFVCEFRSFSIGKR